jgi:threonine dehydratase
VSEHYIALAILRLVEMEKAVVEGSGAAALAPLLAGQLPELKVRRYMRHALPLCFSHWLTICVVLRARMW